MPKKVHGHVLIQRLGYVMVDDYYVVDFKGILLTLRQWQITSRKHSFLPRILLKFSENLTFCSQRYGSSFRYAWVSHNKTINRRDNRFLMLESLLSKRVSIHGQLYVALSREISIETTIKLLKSFFYVCVVCTWILFIGDCLYINVPSIDVYCIAMHFSHILTSDIFRPRLYFPLLKFCFCFVFAWFFVAYEFKIYPYKLSFYLLTGKIIIPLLETCNLAGTRIIYIYT